MPDTKIYCELLQKKFQDAEKSLISLNGKSASIAAKVPKYTAFLDEYVAMTLSEYNTCELKICGT